MWGDSSSPPRNILYVYPLSLNFNFRSGKGRNIGVKVQLMAGEGKKDSCCVIYGNSCSPSFLRETWCPILYHNKYDLTGLTFNLTLYTLELSIFCRHPQFYEEIKIELPAKLTDRHHLLFSFYHVSCQKPFLGESFYPDPSFLGCTVSLVTACFSLSEVIVELARVGRGIYVHIEYEWQVKCLTTLCFCQPVLFYFSICRFVAK